MLFMSANLGFFLVLMGSIIFSLSSHSLFFFWLSLEVNMMAVVPVISSFSSINSNEISLKYFISQGVASVIFILLLALSSFISVKLIFVLFSLTIFFKMGLPPFHSWLVSIILISPMKIIYLILFVQKFIPLHILSCLLVSGHTFTVLTLLTIFISFSYLKNLFNIRVALMISAWVNSLWMILATIGKAWFIFLSLYGIFMYSIVFLSSKFNIHKFSSVLNSQSILKIFFLLGFLNLAGLPPFSGFFMKLFILKCSMMSMSLLTILMLLYASLMVLFSYLMISFYIMSVSAVKNTVSSSSMSLASLICFFSFFSFPLLSVFSV